MTIAQVLLSVWLGVVWGYTAVCFLAVLVNVYIIIFEKGRDKLQNAEMLFFGSLTILTIYYNVWG